MAVWEVALLIKAIKGLKWIFRAVPLASWLHWNLYALIMKPFHSAPREGLLRIHVGRVVFWYIRLIFNLSMGEFVYQMKRYKLLYLLNQINNETFVLQNQYIKYLRCVHYKITLVTFCHSICLCTLTVVGMVDYKTIVIWTTIIIIQCLWFTRECLFWISMHLIPWQERFASPSGDATKTGKFSCSTNPVSSKEKAKCLSSIYLQYCSFASGSLSMSHFARNIG